MTTLDRAAAIQALVAASSRTERVLGREFVEGWADTFAEAILTPTPPAVDREALEKLVADWRQSADEDERYLNTKVHASEVHDVEASIRIGREHAAALMALLNGNAS